MIAITRTLSNGWTLDLQPVERTIDSMRTVELLIDGAHSLKISVCGDTLYSIYPAPAGAPSNIAGVAKIRVGRDAVQIGLTSDELSFIKDWLSADRSLIASKKSRAAEKLRKAREYDRIVNEGGEGYNPFRN